MFYLIDWLDIRVLGVVAVMLVAMGVALLADLLDAVREKHESRSKR